MAKIHTDPNRILVSGQSLAATAVGRKSQFTLSNVVGSAEDVDIAIDAPNGESVSANVVDAGEGNFHVEFCPQVAGEHQIYLSFASEPGPGSPFACKVHLMHNFFNFLRIIRIFINLISLNNIITLFH